MKCARKPGHLIASYSTPLTSAGAPFCETMRIERRRSKPVLLAVVECSVLLQVFSARSNLALYIFAFPLSCKEALMIFPHQLHEATCDCGKPTSENPAPLFKAITN